MRRPDPAAQARRLAPTLGALLCLGAVGAGCRTRAPDVPLPPMGVMQKLPDDGARAANYPPLDRQTHAAFAARAAASPAPAARKLNVLVLSGGGQYSSYAAGVLIGWRRRGDKPEFDAINGISSGSLLASIAFVGPKFEPLMERVFTELRQKDLFRVKPTNLLKYQAVASSEPLRELIEREVSREFIDQMRVEHAGGRRLYVGTTNENTRRLVVWDLGAIACSGRPDADCLVRRVLLASASIEGLLPAVDFDVAVDGAVYRESHADGGTSAESFLRLPPDAPRPDPANPAAPWLAGSNLYVIAGGKLYADPYPEKPSFKDRTVGSISGTLHALHRSDLWRMYAHCAASGMAFHQTYIPESFDIPVISTTFDPAAMRRMFDAGRAAGLAGVPWRTTPPGAEAGEEEFPRAGFVFTSGAGGAPLAVTNPTVSVVVPAYNAAAFLPAALASVWAQTLPALEVVVADDASADGTADLVERLAATSPVPLRLVRLARNSGGPAAPLNAAIRAARGGVIAALDQDDEFPPGKLAAHAGLLARHPELGLTFGDLVPVGPDPARNASVEAWFRAAVDSLPKVPLQGGGWRVGSAGALVGVIRHRTFVSTCSNMVFPKSAWRSVGGFDEGTTACCDLAFLAAVSARFDLGYLAGPAAVWTLRPESFYRTSSAAARLRDHQRVFAAMARRPLPPGARRELRAVGRELALAGAADLARAGARREAAAALWRAARQTGPWLAGASALAGLLRSRG